DLAAQALPGTERDGSPVGSWEGPSVGQQAVRGDRGTGQRFRRVPARAVESGGLAPGRHPVRGLLVTRCRVKFQLSTSLDTLGFVPGDVRCTMALSQLAYATPRPNRSHDLPRAAH